MLLERLGYFPAARASGFSEHLTKPINFDRLEQVIQQLLGRNVEERVPAGATQS